MPVSIEDAVRETGVEIASKSKLKQMLMSLLMAEIPPKGEP